MSSTPAPTMMKLKERLTEEPAWGEPVSEYEMTAEIKGGDVFGLGSPIVVDGDKLEINSALLDVGRVYSFEYLGTQMVLWKLPNGAIDLYEVVEE